MRKPLTVRDAIEMNRFVAGPGRSGIVRGEVIGAIVFNVADQLAPDMTLAELKAELARLFPDQMRQGG